MTNAERQKAWRERHPVQSRRQDKDRHRKLRAEGREAPRRYPRGSNLEFIAVDGEGGGTDERYRQNYQFISAADMHGRCWLGLHELRLSTWQILMGILSLPKRAILVGYFFGYDVTQILRDLPPERMADLFADKSERKNKYTYWQQFGIEYVPKQYFRVCRIDRNTCKVIDGTARTINECGGFFQKPFVEALRDWGITDDLDMIASNKDRRDQFDIIGPQEIEYCRAECRALAILMTRLREACKEAGIVPRHWRGAGHIAARLHELHKTPKRKDRKRVKIIDQLAEAAYYGGRFEVTAVGRVNGEVWEYDINSAYPAAMLELPCPLHGRWKRFNSLPDNSSRGIFLSDISFQHPDSSFLCGFPIRERGRLYFPRMGSGFYWSPEINAAVENGANVRYYGGYHYACSCSCRPFDWVRELYEFRKSKGKETIGYPVKLGINGLYGKFAQKIGAAPWQDYVMAGLITAHTRAKLMRAYAQAPNDILYIATDALYSRKRLNLDIGGGLGQWTETRRDGMFIVQPGIYWSGEAKPKTRGIPRSVVIENRGDFERAFDDWLGIGGIGNAPVVDVFVNQFIGIRSAIARGKPDLAGSWLKDRRAIEPEAGIRHIDFDWKNKRQPRGDYIRGECMVTMPFKGRPTLRSEPYSKNAETDFDIFRRELEEADDCIPWGNSGE